VQATTGTLCAVGFGGFFVYLAMFQRPLKVLGIEKAIRDGTAERGLVLGSVTRDAFLVFTGVWFCTVNPLVRSRRPAVLRRLHAIDARRLRETRSWVVFFWILGPFGPLPVNTMLRAGRGVILEGLRPRRAREAARFE
jgi:hypothetical protein